MYERIFSRGPMNSYNTVNSRIMDSPFLVTPCSIVAPNHGTQQKEMGNQMSSLSIHGIFVDFIRLGNCGILEQDAIVGIDQDGL